MAKSWDGIVDDGGFSDSDERSYNEGMDAIRTGLENGLDFDEACKAVSETDPELKRLIIDDYLKVSLAHMHFEQELPVEEVAAKLKVSVERLVKARQEMIDEVRDRSMEHAREQFGDIGEMFKNSGDSGETGGNA